MKKTLKSKNGITLIALIITVIIMLILAGVAIAAVVDGDGLFSKTRQATETYENAAREEGDTIQSMINQIDEYLGNAEEGETLVEAFNAGKIKVGDYITNYNDKVTNKSKEVSIEENETGVEGTQTYKFDTNTTWRVLGLNENGTQLVITTGSPIRRNGADPYLHLASGESYYYTNDEYTDDNILDRICEIYETDLAQETRSMRIEDINMLLGLEFNEETGKLYKKDDLTTELPVQSFVGAEYEYVGGDYAFENYMKEKYPENTEYQSLESKEAGDVVSGTAYWYPYERGDSTETNPILEGVDEKLYEVLFDGTLEEDRYAKSYWLASPGVYAPLERRCNFGPGAVFDGFVARGHNSFYSGGRFHVLWFGVRPVVYLKSNILLKDVTISSSGSEAEWTETAGGDSGNPLEYGQIPG